MLDAAVRREIGAVAAEFVASDANVHQCVELCAEFNLDAKTLAIKCDTFITKEMHRSLSKCNTSSASKIDLLHNFRTYLRDTMLDTPMKVSPSLLTSISTPMPFKRKLSELEMYGIRNTEATSINTVHATSSPPKLKAEARDLAESSPGTLPRQRLNFDLPLESPVISPRSTTSYHAQSIPGLGAASAPEALPMLPVLVDLVQVSPRIFTMVDNLQKRAKAVDEAMLRIQHTLVTKHNPKNLGELANPSQVPAMYLGRVCWEQESGSASEKLGRHHIVLEADMAGFNHRARLDVSAVAEAACFPGQIVLVHGLSDGRHAGACSLTLSSIISDAALPVAPLTSNPAIHAVIAHGPFIDRQARCEGSLNFAPVTRILDRAFESDANLLVMVGPFVDIYDPIVKALVGLPYEDVFQTEFLQNHVLCHQLVKSGRTHVVLIPSTRDGHHSSVFPQPPFSVRTRLPPTVHLLSNPASFSVGGVVFGVCGHDTIWDMNKNAITRGTDRPRVFDCVRQLVEQQSYFPLHPAPEHSISGRDSLDVAVDFSRISGMMMKGSSPHVLITPSMMKEFVTNVHGVVCVNPGRLMRTTQPGTFAELRVKPTVDLDESMASAGIAMRTKVDILPL